jgi:glycosyltransferase involved in cell wall biosynthesis
LNTGFERGDFCIEIGSPSIDSVIVQSIGFRENVQLILVNDGSPDGCGAICEAYKAKYPENVVYIEQVNLGVSAARNVGLDVAVGEFVAFLDGDDRYEGDFLKNLIAQNTTNTASLPSIPTSLPSSLPYKQVDLSVEYSEFFCDEWYKRLLSDDKTESEYFCPPTLSAETKTTLFALSDSTIQQSDNLSYWQKLYLLNLKYPEQRTKRTDKIQVTITSITECGGNIVISGFCDTLDSERICVVALYNDVSYACNYTNALCADYIEELLNGCSLFNIAVPYSIDGKISLYAEIAGNGLCDIELKFDELCKINDAEFSFVLGEETIISRSTVNVLSVTKLTEDSLRTSVISYYKSGISVPQEVADIINQYLAQYPILSKRRIWLFEENMVKVKSSVSALFEYCSAINDEADKYYVTRDYSNLTAYGNAILYGTDQHKQLSVFAEKIVSDAIEYRDIQPFDEQYSLFLPLLRSSFVSLPGSNQLQTLVSDIDAVAVLSVLENSSRTFYKRISEPPVVSVVVPICNVEDYLTECLESLRQQTLRDIEVICVDDGSKDKSLRIMKRFAAADSRFKIVTGANAGYGAACNKGLSAATGKYIGILESDDFCANNFYFDLVKIAEENNCDLVKSEFNFYFSDGRTQYSDNFPEALFDRVFALKDVDSDFNIYDAKSSLWSAIYSRELLEKNKIRFLETPGASYQDVSFVVKTFTYAKRIYLTRNAYVNYRQNPTQSVRSLGKPWFVFEEYAEIEKYCKMTPQMLAAKYHNYMFNFNRIGIEHKYPFLERFSAEFKKHINDNPGIVEPRYYQPWEPGHLQIIIDEPLMYYDIRIREIYDQRGWYIIPAENQTRRNKVANNPLISIIVPCYNVEYWVLQCLESLINQKDSDDIEIICVDDCSTDRTLDILEYTAGRDGRVKIVTQFENKGVSAARNLGISIARGKFLLFVDSDDMLAINSVSVLKAYLDNYSEINIVNFSGKAFPQERALDWHRTRFKRTGKYLEQLPNNAYFTYIEFSPFIWINCIRRDWIIANKIIFEQELHIGEDAIFLGNVYSQIDKVLIIEEQLYLYRQRDGSLMSLINADRQIEIISKLLANIKTRDITFVIQPVIVQWLIDFVYREVIEFPDKGKEFVDVLYEYGYTDNMPLSAHYKNVMENDFKRRIREAGL